MAFSGQVSSHVAFALPRGCGRNYLGYRQSRKRAGESPTYNGSGDGIQTRTFQAYEAGALSFKLPRTNFTNYYYAIMDDKHSGSGLVFRQHSDAELTMLCRQCI